MGHVDQAVLEEVFQHRNDPRDPAEPISREAATSRAHYRVRVLTPEEHPEAVALGRVRLLLTMGGATFQQC